MTIVQFPPPAKPPAAQKPAPRPNIEGKPQYRMARGAVLFDGNGKRLAYEFVTLILD